MSVAKIIEIKASSKTSADDAVKVGLKKIAGTVKNVQGAWVKGTQVMTDESGNIVEWRVDLKVTFLVQ